MVHVSPVGGVRDRLMYALQPRRAQAVAVNQFSQCRMEETHVITAKSSFFPEYDPYISFGPSGCSRSQCVAPLKVLGQELGLPVHYIPPGKEKGALKTWQVRTGITRVPFLAD